MIWPIAWIGVNTGKIKDVYIIMSACKIRSKFQNAAFLLVENDLIWINFFDKKRDFQAKATWRVDLKTNFILTKILWL